MTTSLAQQLRLLAIPQSLQQVEARKKISLLFDPKEAGQLDRKTFYDIGIDGLRELIELDPAFEEFKDNIFELSSISLERTVESKEINVKLDKLIKKFLHLLSPYLLLKSSHKVLEWLVCRYLIHEFNVEDLMALILPYHQTNIFVKILQLINLKRPQCNHWNWLIDIQKQGLHLPKSVLVNHAISDPAFLRFICNTMMEIMKTHSKHGSTKKLGTLITFYCTTLVSLLSRGSIDEKLLTIILPSFIKSLKTEWVDFKAAGYMIGGQLVSSNSLTKLILDEMISHLLKDTSEVLQRERVLLLVLIFQTQKQPEIPEEMLDKLFEFPKILKSFAVEGALVGNLIIKLVWTCLHHVIKVGDYLVEAQNLSWTLSTEVDMDLVNCKNLIRVIDESHTMLEDLLRLPTPKKKRDPSLLKWMKELMGASLEKHSDILEKSKDDLTFQKIRDKWRSEEEIEVQEKAIIKLMKKCNGKNKESTWLQLRPLLLHKIENDKVFQALCKIAPTYDYMVLLLCLERLLISQKYSEQIQESTFKKIFKSEFGKNNPLLLEIKTKLEEHEKKNVLEIVRSCLIKTRAEAEIALEFEPWHAALEELKKLDKFAEHNAIWNLGLEVLNAALAAQFNPGHALQLWKLLFLIKKGKETQKVVTLNSLYRKKNFQIAKEILETIMPHLEKMTTVRHNWFDFKTMDSTIFLKIKVTEFLLHGIHSNKLFTSYCLSTLDKFSKTCFVDQSEFLIFLSAVCSGNFFASDPDSKLPPTLQLYGLHAAWMRLCSKEKLVYDLNKAEISKLICYLLITLGNESLAIREAALKVLEALAALFKTYDSDPVTIFLEFLVSRFEEIDLDLKQLHVALYCCLSPAVSVQSVLPKHSVPAFTKVREMILETITSDDVPLSVAGWILQALEGINSPEIIKTLSKLANRAIESKTYPEISNKILADFWLRLNETTADVLECPEIWNLAVKSIKHAKCDDLCPGVTFLKSITKEVFELLPDKKKFELLELMVVTRSETESSPVGSCIASVMKKISVDSEIIIPLIKRMTAPFIGPQKPKEANPIVLASIIIESKEWKCGLSLLELIQSKKKLQNSHVLLEHLFYVLKFCLDQEEQTSFEYTKQLALGSLLSCCQKLSPGNLIVDESVLNVELVVQCLRASPNPQTHHHALLLLSCLAALIPSQVMHNIMAIFTFMGSSLARLDDEYSVKILTQVVEMVTPVLLESFTKEDLSNKVVMAEILRVFVWALRDIPQHRRKPLFLQLLTTLKPERSLWKFLILLFENYVKQGVTTKNEGLTMPESLHLGLELCLAMTPEIVMDCVMEVVNYLNGLPLDKMNPEGSPNRKTLKKEKRQNDGLFDAENHTPKEIRHFAYTALTFFNSLLSDNNFIAQAMDANAKEPEDMELVFEESIAAIMKFIPAVNRQYEKLQNKFWKVMTHHCYELLDKLVSLVSNEMLLNVITKLLNHSVGPLRRKALDLLNTRLQNHKQDFSASEKNHMRSLIDPLLAIVGAIGKETEQEAELIQQTALFSIKLIAKLLAYEDTRFFKQVLMTLCDACKTKKCQGPLLGSVLLTIAELVACLKAHAISELPIFMPIMLEIFSQKTQDQVSDLGLTSVVMALLKIVEILRHFLSPYLNSLVTILSIASVNFKENSELLKRFSHMRHKLSNDIAYRVFIPAITGCYETLVKDENYEALGPLMTLLGESVATSTEVLKYLPDLTQFFIKALEFRSDRQTPSSNVSLEIIDKTEGFVIEALLPLVLKLSESSFKPLYYQLFHWSSEHSDRSITFYRLSHRLAEKLKGLFVLFAGSFLQNAAQLLDATNLSKTENLYYGNTEIGQQKSIILLENILKTLHSVFLYDSTDSTNFLNKDKFEVLLHPLVDQLENTLGGIESLEKRTESLLTPCLAQMALATDDILWKSLNYQILVKTKSSIPQVRIGTLETIVAIATKLGEDYLMLLPETVGSLAELLEDDDERVENAIKKAIQKLEDVLGEPVKEYFH